jgi:hypothetical protein
MYGNAVVDPVLKWSFLFICPVLETFDTWDPPIQVGNDTEYTLVILALCTGAVYSLARFVMKSPRTDFVAKESLSFPRAEIFPLRAMFHFAVR